MNLRTTQTWGRRLLWSSVFAVPLLSSCVSGPQTSGSAPTGSRSPVQIQPETRWPTGGAWWAKEDPVALQNRIEIIRSSSRWKRLNWALLLASKVVDVTKTERSGMKITFRLNESASQNLVLIGPEKLSRYVSKGQEVMLNIDEKGNIASIAPFVKLVHWQLEGSLIRTKFVAAGVSNHSISLLMTEPQFFESYEVKNEREFQDAYFSAEGLTEKGRNIWWKREFDGKSYLSMSQSQKTRLLASGTDYEISITSRGVYGWGSTGKGGGEDNAPEWIVSSPASEDFE